MAFKHCTMCDRPVQTRRKIGVGTLLLVLFTLGWWLLAIPFYRQRCPICWGDVFTRVDKSSSAAQGMFDRKQRTTVLVAIAIVVVLYVYMAAPHA